MTRIAEPARKPPRKTQPVMAVEYPLPAGSFNLLLDRRPAVEAAYGKKRAALYEDIAAGLFPPAVKIGARASAWPRHEVQAIVAARIAGKSDDEIKTLVRKLVTARAHAIASESWQ